MKFTGYLICKDFIIYSNLLESKMRHKTDDKWFYVSCHSWSEEQIF